MAKAWAVDGHSCDWNGSSQWGLQFGNGWAQRCSIVHEAQLVVIEDLLT